MCLLPQCVQNERQACQCSLLCHYLPRTWRLPSFPQLEKHIHFVGMYHHHISTPWLYLFLFLSSYLFSVSPWMTKHLQKLCMLKECIAMLRCWQHGFFSMIPIGVTTYQDQLWCHVFFITFTLHDTDPTTTHVSRNPAPTSIPARHRGTYDEAVYSTASRLLNGQPPTATKELSGFCLWGMIMLTFEMPETFTLCSHWYWMLTDWPQHWSSYYPTSSIQFSPIWYLRRWALETQWSHL